MKSKKKLNISEPICGIHTICIIINGYVPENISERARDCITKEYSHVHKRTGELRTKIVLNANKWYGKNGWCRSYTEYQDILWKILYEIGVDSYSLNRVDFAINYIDDNYDSLRKTHKCICLLAAHKYKILNNYESRDPLKLEHLTTRVQSEYIEIENYNKKLESSGRSQFANRLELRNKALNQRKTNFQSVEKLVYDWNRRFNSFITQYEAMTFGCNKYIKNRWTKEQGTEVKDLSEFIRKYQDNIFSLKQLTALYSEFGVKNPKGSAKNFIRYNKIEFISINDIAAYFDIIEKSLKRYFAEGATTALTGNIVKCA